MSTTDKPSDISFLLGDFDAQTFFEHYWERRSLHLPGKDPQRFAHLISHDSLFEREVQRCAHLKASTRGADGWNVEIPIRPEQAAKMFKAGFTICASVLDEQGPVSEVIAAFGAAVSSAGPPHVNCYYSPDQRGYGLHFDTHPVWILQVSGSKHWTVSHEPGVRNPPFNVLFPPQHERIKLPWITLDRPDVTNPELFMHVRLDPGDVLYIPAGGWHAARAEGASLALTLALARVSTLDLFGSLVNQAAVLRLPDVAVRLEPFPKAGQPQHAEQRARLLDKLRGDLARLKELVGALDAEGLLQIYEHHAAHPDGMRAQRTLLAAKEQVGVMKALGDLMHSGR